MQATTMNHPPSSSSSSSSCQQQQPARLLQRRQQQQQQPIFQWCLLSTAVGIILMSTSSTATFVSAWVPSMLMMPPGLLTKTTAVSSTFIRMKSSIDNNNINDKSDKDSLTTTTRIVNTRRDFVSAVVAGAASVVTSTLSSSLSSPPSVPVANAIGPVYIDLKHPIISKAQPCPKDRPIPGEKAMKGMRGLCVTVQATLSELPDKPLSKVGVYGFVTDVESGESVLANNPDFGTDAGQFAMIESVSPDDSNISFEFIAAVPMNKDLSKFDNGIGPIAFDSLKIISFPGGQQFGAISPCEMNEFSDECEAWEAENGPYERGDFMIRPNSRTKGR